MKVLAENYKGIEFIRISRLPEEQKQLITQSLPSDQVIKILKENELLSDCVQFKHYEKWFDGHFTKAIEAERSIIPAATEPIKLAVNYSQTPSGTISKTFPSGSSK